MAKAKKASAEARAGRTPRRRKLTPAEARVWAAARRAGEAAADHVLARRNQRMALAIAGPSPGLLVAEGDSWFDYPGLDVLEALEDLHGWEVVSVAHAGDRVEDMAYDEGQLAKLERALRKVRDRGKIPSAVLLSGGGNDIAGEEFAMLLNHKKSKLPALNPKVVAGLLEDRLTAAIVFLASSVTRLCNEIFVPTVPIPILLHGYAPPVPDGRGFLGGFSILPGPWLEPGFRRKGFFSQPRTQLELQEATDLMADLIKAFNDRLARIAGSTGLKHVRYVDVRKELSNELPKKYRDLWSNELHPTNDGFQAVADRIHRALKP